MHARNPEPISEADGKKLRGFTFKAVLARKPCRPQLTSTLGLKETEAHGTLYAKKNCIELV